MIMRSGPMSMLISEEAFSQMRSGVQTLRAIEALCAITGNYDVRGGMLPHAQPSVEERVLHEFVAAVQCNVPHEKARGSRRYPLFAHFSRQCQLGSEPPDPAGFAVSYPRTVLFFGLNINGYPNNKSWTTALESLDFLWIQTCF